MRNHLFAYLSVSFALGILLSHHFTIPFNLCIPLLTIALILIASYFSNKTVFHFSILLFIVFLGSFRSEVYNRLPKFSDETLAKEHFFQLKLKSQLNDSEKFHKYITKIESIDSLKTENQRLLLYIRKETGKQPNAGELVWVHGKAQKIPNAKNPQQFDYGKFMQNKRVLCQMFTDSILFSKPSKDKILIFFGKVKSKIKKQLKEKGYNQNSRTLISALLLGDRSDLTTEQKEQFAKAGVMHLLAISGLHVGILFAIFFFIFSFFFRFKQGKFIQISLSLALIWCFAAFVNFTPSVSRAAFMLSVYYVAILLGRPQNIYHSLALSAFVLPWWNPNFLFDVGFQLSYSAVFFIAYLVPIVKEKIKFQRKWKRYGRDLIGVTLAAQLGTLPLSIFYFHRFSFLFLVGNLVLIPISGIMIVGGLLSIVFSFFSDRLIAPFVLIYNEFCDCVFWFIECLSQQNRFIFSDIYISIYGVFILFGLLISLRFVILNKNKVWLVVFLGLILVGQMQRAYQHIKSNRKEEFIVFHSNQNSIIGIREGKKLDVFVKDSIDFHKQKPYVLDGFLRKELIKNLSVFNLGKEIKKKSYQKTQNVIEWNQKLFLITNQMNNEVPKKFDYVILQNQKYKSIQCNVNQSFLILDGTNYKNELSPNCESNHWNTYEKGAFTLSLQNFPD